MFNKCCSLISLPDLSRWNTSKLIDMSFMFNDCISLIFLPDLSNPNIIDINFIFSEGNSLNSLDFNKEIKILM